MGCCNSVRKKQQDDGASGSRRNLNEETLGLLSGKGEYDYEDYEYYDTSTNSNGTGKFMSKTKRREEELRRIVQQASENLIDVGSMNSLGVGFPSQAMVTNSSSGQVSALQTDISLRKPQNTTQKQRQKNRASFPKPSRSSVNFQSEEPKSSSPSSSAPSIQRNNTGEISSTNISHYETAATSIRGTGAASASDLLQTPSEKSNNPFSSKKPNYASSIMDNVSIEEDLEELESLNSKIPQTPHRSKRQPQPASSRMNSSIPENSAIFTG